MKSTMTVSPSLCVTAKIHSIKLKTQVHSMTMRDCNFFFLFTYHDNVDRSQEKDRRFATLKRRKKNTSTTPYTVHKIYAKR